jgi:hypothetical protein
MSIQSIDWVTNYNGFIGTLAKSTADAWAVVIRENLPNVKAGEVNDAVAALCSEQRGFNAPKPNALSIIHKIKEQRGYRYNHGHKPTSNHVSYIDGNNQAKHTTMAELKGFLKRKPDPNEAWDIICTPLDTDQCKELHRFADDNGVVYERFVPCIAGAIGEIVSLYERR